METQLTKDELTALYMTWLAADGFRPEIDKDGDVAFKYEGASLFIRPAVDDPQFHVIAMPGIWSIDSEAERARVRIAALKATAETKVVKVVVYNNSVWVLAELFLPKRECFKDIYERCLRALQAARRTFVQAMSEPEPQPSRDTREEALGPRGAQTLTCGGHMTIDRPALPSDPATDAFEARLLGWLEQELKVKPICHAGSNALFWRVEFNGKTVDLGLVGRHRNHQTQLAPGVDWLLRIEESEPLDFIARIEQHFVDTERIRRRLRDGKIKIQFKSTELRPESALA